MVATSRVQHVPGQNLTLKAEITDVYVQYYLNTYPNVNLRYYFRALTWYHNDNKLTPGGRILLSSDNTTLTVINSTVADSGVYEARFDGLLIHPYSRYCEEAVLDILRHVLKPAIFYVGTTSTGEYNVELPTLTHSVWDTRISTQSQFHMHYNLDFTCQAFTRAIVWDANFYLTHPFFDLVSARSSSWQTAHARVGGVVWWTSTWSFTLAFWPLRSCWPWRKKLCTLWSGGAYCVPEAL